MRRLVIILVILGALGTGADVTAQQWAEGQIEARARAELPDEVSVSADIKAFPFLPPLLLGGRVSEAKGHFENVPAGPLTLAAVDITLRGVRVNRDKLLGDRKVELTKISSGTVSFEIEASVLSKAIGVPVKMSNGRVQVAGVPVPVTVKDGKLIFSAAGVSKSLTLPRTRLVPCATDVTVLADRLRVSCTIENVPPGLVGAANRELNGD